MQTRVLLLRHGESANPRIFHGAESDVDLSERGARQADAVAFHLVRFAPVAVISSAMRRARATAEPIARACGLTVLVEPDLHERRVGILSGTPVGLNEGPYQDTIRHWMAGCTDYTTPGAESFDDIRARVVPVWQRLAAEYEGRTLIVVAHGVVIRVLLLSILPGRSPAEWQTLGPVPNVAITELVQTGPGDEWRAERVHDRIAD
jgi:probable phosphoglycerate mutase